MRVSDELCMGEAGFVVWTAAHGRDGRHGTLTGETENFGAGASGFSTDFSFQRRIIPTTPPALIGYLARIQLFREDG